MDSKFTFAWDNIGVCYRQMDNYDKAIEAYKKSLAIDPKGKTPLQNLAVAYSFKKDYKNALDTYEKMKLIYPDNPEADFGIGRIYTFYLLDMEKALNHICAAYILYTEQKSPYRTDAESVISYIYAEMKKNKQEKEFMKILKDHGISSE
ncbi:photosystem I assembly protein Ycf3 [compost metagenome]